MEQVAITEENSRQLLKDWQEEARKQTLDTLPVFLQKLTTEYHHDYGTICHAVAAAACGAAWAVNASEQGGITGFQGGAVLWEFIRAWQYSSNVCGLRIVDYDNVLYPQYEDNFQYMPISEGNWKAIQKEAKAKLVADAEREVAYAAEVLNYKQKLADFVARYPDYYEREKHYLPLGMGNGDEWQAEDEKRASGFEFAPTEPWPGTAHPNIKRHWQRIVRGVVPFDMRVEKD